MYELMVNKGTSSSPIKKIYKVSCVLFGSAQYVPGLYEAFIMTIFAMLMFPWKWGLQRTWALSGALLNSSLSGQSGAEDSFVRCVIGHSRKCHNIP